MISQTFIQGLRRLLNSSHVQASVAGLSAAFATAYFAAPGLPPAGKAALWISFMAAAGVVLRETINAITEENVASIQASAPAVAPATIVLPVQSNTDATKIANLEKAMAPTNRVMVVGEGVIPPRTTLPGMK